MAVSDNGIYPTVFGNELKLLESLPYDDQENTSSLSLRNNVYPMAKIKPVLLRLRLVLAYFLSFIQQRDQCE